MTDTPSIMRRYNLEFQAASGSREMVARPDGEWISWKDFCHFTDALLYAMDKQSEALREALGIEAGP